MTDRKHVSPSTRKEYNGGYTITSNREIQALEQALQGLFEQEQVRLKNLLNRICDNLD